VVTKVNPFQVNPTKSLAVSIPNRGLRTPDFKLWTNADKSGELLKATQSGQWNVRWFILKESMLFYFDSKPTEGETSSKSIDIKDSKIQRVEVPDTMV
jgi:hypothetical protein